MKVLNVLILVAASAGMALGFAPVAPEIGLGGSTLVAAIGLVTGGLLILRSRRKGS